MLLDAVEVGCDFGGVGGRSADYLYLFSCTQDDPHSMFMVLVHACLDEEAGCVDLAEPAGGSVVAVDGEIGVVEDDDGGFGHSVS